MNSNLCCSKCHFEIPEERLLDPVVVCQACGHTESAQDSREEDAVTKKFMVFIVAGGFLFAAYLVSIFKWQDHLFTASTIQLKSGIGVASNDDLKRLSKICKELKDADCVEDAHRAIANSDAGDAEDLRSYGHVLFLRGKDAESLQVYTEYFKRGGNHDDALFDYARLLSRAGRHSEASIQFLRLINSKPNIMQHTVAAAYVEHLLKLGEIKKAKVFIRKWRTKGSNASHFLEAQWQQIQKLEAQKT